jgi:ubiquitin-large subunit ribosomal protein L40e
MLTGKTITVDDVTPQTTFEELTFAIEDKEGIPTTQQRLIFSGRQLPSSSEHTATLADFNIDPWRHQVHLVLRLESEVGLCYFDNQVDGTRPPSFSLEIGEHGVRPEETNTQLLERCARRMRRAEGVAGLAIYTLEGGAPLAPDDEVRAGKYAIRLATIVKSARKS